jgi:hypothetical protein
MISQSHLTVVCVCVCVCARACVCVYVYVYMYIQGDKSLCAPDGYSTKNTQNYFKQFQSLTMIT